MTRSLKRIQYIEDDEDIATVVKMALEIVGEFEVHLFSSGHVAIDAYSNISPDLILLDVMMPEIDGPETIKRLLAIHKESCAPFIFMTARAQPHEQQAYRDLGAIDVITKPFDPMALCSLITNIWNSNHAA